LENSRCADYWTEKLSDAFLAGAFPIYHGCPNILDYFEKNSLAEINIEHPEEALEKIEQVLQAEISESALLEARNRILDRYNLFVLAERFARERASDSPSASRTLRPSLAFQRAPNLAARALGKVRRIAKL
jgi:hypothetical protein